MTSNEQDRARKGTWLRCWEPRESPALRLLCFPFAGGGPSQFRDWPKRLPETIEVWAAELPGRERRFSEPLVTDLEAIVAAILAELPRAEPWALFGHSLGALVAFELARRLPRAGRPQPRHLFVAASPGPTAPRVGAPAQDLSDAALVTRLRKLGGTPEIVFQTPELLACYLPILRADLTLADTYVRAPGAPLTCPITAFGGARDPHARRHELERWRAETTEAFELKLVDGDHFSILDASSSVFARMAETLTSARRGARKVGSPFAGE